MDSTNGAARGHYQDGKTTTTSMEQGVCARATCIRRTLDWLGKQWRRRVYSPWAPAKKSDDYYDTSATRAMPWRERMGRCAYERRFVLACILLGALVGLVNWLADDVTVVVSAIRSEPSNNMIAEQPDVRRRQASSDAHNVPSVFARYSSLAPPAASLALGCDELVNGSARAVLHPYHLGAHIDEALRSAQRAAGEMGVLAKPLRRAMLLNDLHALAEQALLIMPADKLPCACAPMFGELRRHLTLRPNAAANETSFRHLHNPTVRVTNATLIVEVNDVRQDYLFPTVSADRVVRNQVSRASELLLSYRAADARCTLHTDAIRVTGAVAFCVQDCMELMMGKSIYAL